MRLLFGFCFSLCGDQWIYMAVKLFSMGYDECHSMLVHTLTRRKAVDVGIR